MSAEGRPDPDEYTPEPDPVTAAEEHAPEGNLVDPTREADMADVADVADMAERLVAVPTDDDVGPDLTDED